MKTSSILTLIAVLLAAAILLFLGLTQTETLIPALNAFLMIGLGLGLGFLLHHRFGLPWGLYGAGALTFILSQVGHIPFNLWVLNPFLARVAPQAGPNSGDLLLWGALLGLSAGVFEETARYLVLRFWQKDVRTWRLSVMFGAGHGGIEAVLVGLFAFLGFMQLALFRQFDPQAFTGLSEGPQLEALQFTLKTYWGYNWYEHLWGSLERFSVLPIHLSATVLVYKAVRDRNLLWYLAAVAWHTLVDFFAVYASQSWGIPQTEGIIFVLGLLSWGIVFLLRDSHPPPEPEPERTETVIKPPAGPLPPAEEPSLTDQDLEESRYD